MNKQYHLLEEVDSYIRKEYKNDLKKMNRLICLLKTNYNNIENIKILMILKLFINKQKVVKKNC